MRNLFIRDQMKWIEAVIGLCMSFNSENQSDRNHSWKDWKSSLNKFILRYGGDN